MSDDTITCRVCGKTETLHWIAERNQSLQENQLCFTCDFWNEKVAIRDEPNIARINGHHYTIGPEPKPDTPNHVLGFAGAHNKIRFTDGHIIETRNLWYQGKIPDQWRDKLPNNAGWA